MLVEDRRTDRSDAILYHQIIPVVGQSVSRGVVVQARDDRADAAAFRSSLDVYLIESNFSRAYAFFRFGICFIQFLNMKLLEINRLSLNGGRRRSHRRKGFA